MTERRVTALVAGLSVFVVLAVLWDVFGRPGRSATRPEPADTASGAVTAVAGPATPASIPAAGGDTAAGGVRTPPVAVAAPPGPSYVDLVARAEVRRRIRASAGVTYLGEIVAASTDSMLHRWDNRITRPVRVWLRPGTAANYQPAFLDAVRGAFRRWEEVGVPVRFDLNADSGVAEVQLAWRIQFELERSGQTDVTWNENGHLQTGTITIATFDPRGRPLTPNDVHVVALHEIGHLIGLDHSPDSSDIMFPVARVRSLSNRDIQTATLLYQLTPGSLR